MRPEDVGVPETRLVLGKHSGRHALRERLTDLGYHLGEQEFERAFSRFKELADRKRGIADADLAAIVQAEVVAAAPQVCHLAYFHVVSGTSTVPTATVRVTQGENAVQESAAGDGPVDAVYRAIDRAVGQDFLLVDYALRAVTGDKDALGEVTVRLRDTAGRTATALGASTDVLEASARAYMAAVNKLLALQGGGLPEGSAIAVGERQV
jgi:2-isopropylmalate synthase